jgi:hypothetical protein
MGKIDELLGRKSSGYGFENRDYDLELAGYMSVMRFYNQLAG